MNDEAGEDHEGTLSGGRKRVKKAQEPLLPSGHGKRMMEFERGKPVSVQGIKDKKLKGFLRRSESKASQAAYDAARADVLLPEQAGYVEAEGMEKTYKFTQDDIALNVDQLSSKKVFNLELKTFGPYSVRYTPNGRQLLIGGRKGHVGAFDWQNGTLGCELHLAETVRDVQWLHNDKLFAVAQKRFVYIYDNTGTEIHLLKHHVDPLCLEFLRYHFLLVSGGNAGFLKYQDVSTGKLVAQHRTKLGPCRVLRQNPYNAVCHLGHGNGTVTLWSPSMSTPLVTQLCHRGPILDLAIDSSGKYMATSGMDGQMKIWDIRNFKDKALFEYFTYTPATSLDISQKGLLAASYGPHVQIWRDAHVSKQQSPYLTHMIPGASIHQCRFAPFEDVLGVGHSEGFSSLLVPGSGEPNFDSMEVNPFETPRQRQETEVRALLDKIPSELITLDPNSILRVHRAPAKGSANARGEEAAEDEGADGKGGKDGELKRKKRGKGSSMRRYLRKNSNIIDATKEAVKKRLEKERKDKAKADANVPEQPRTALDRFKPKED